MARFLPKSPGSLSTVVLVLLAIVALQSSISYTLTFGGLDAFLPPNIARSTVSGAWLGLRVALLAAIILLWALQRKRTLFSMIIVANSILTFGLVLNMTALAQALFHFSGKHASSLMLDVFCMAATNVLIFSIWYWIVDPPGVEEEQREDEPWDFLFPQRASALPHYESWQPRYTDYLYVAFTTSLAFSPADTLPLTRRAKVLMAVQALVSAITLTVIVGSAINILAGND